MHRSHLSSSSCALYQAPCRSLCIAARSLLTPACLHSSGCSRAACAGSGRAAAKKNVSGPETLYLLGAACCFDHRDCTFICRRTRTKEFFNGVNVEKQLKYQQCVLTCFWLCKCGSLLYPVEDTDRGDHTSDTTIKKPLSL